MITAQSSPAINPPRRPPPAALALAAASILTLVLLAHHPMAAHHAGDALLQDLVRLGDSSAHVHGGIIALVCALLYGVIALGLRLGLRRPAVAFGLAAYGFGCAAMTGAMLLDGFVTAPLARWLVSNPAPGGIASLALVAASIQVLTKAGFTAMGLGIACLSWARPRSTPLLAALALPGGLLPILAALAMQMQPHSLILLTGLQLLWYVAAAWHLWRAPLRD